MLAWGSRYFLLNKNKCAAWLEQGMEPLAQLTP
jgi:hypothetical protein